ncbi:hypothetical protein ACFQGE_10040 [Halomicroarcula sp. GCM10025817]|uniref:hypothetical protein n=1 Tax=Haloarcula TaxID=2237 RepID=UPI0023E887B7|nr:hypothetical protein [Halomicroarcula sp. SYNS111]
MHRRRAITLAGTTLLASLAGCSVPTFDESSGVTLERVTVRNYLDESVPVSLLLVADETVVRWTTLTVPGPPNPFAALEDLPDSRRPYVLYAQVPETDRDRPVRADLVEDAGEQSCLTVTLEVRASERDESTVPTVVYGTIGRCRDAQ